MQRPIILINDRWVRVPPCGSLRVEQFGTATETQSLGPLLGANTPSVVAVRATNLRWRLTINQQVWDGYGEITKTRRPSGRAMYRTILQRDP